MAAAAIGAGAEIRRSARVASIDIDEGGARGVVLENGERIEATAVVSGADPRHTFLQLVDPVHVQPSFRQQVLNIRATGVLAKVNLVVNGLPTVTGLESSGMPAEQALSGRLLIGNVPDEFEKVYDCTKYGRMSDRPWLEVALPSLTDTSLAPAGQHVLSIYAQYAPYRLRDGNWESSREALRDLVIARLSEVMPDLTSRIVLADVLTPLDLESRYGLTGGHIFHGEHTLDQLYAMRPVLGWAQHRTPIRGLYLCGAGTHPGGGVTGAPARTRRGSWERICAAAHRPLTEPVNL